MHTADPSSATLLQLEKSESRLKGFVAFVGFCIAAAVVYGIAHDLVTAHVEKSYFLPPHHPDVIGDQGSIALALLWGVIATWWAGLILGCIIALANILGKAHPLPWRRIRKYVTIGLGCVYTVAMLLLIGILIFGNMIPMAQRSATFEVDRRLIAVATAHGWSYLGCAGLAIILAMWIFVSRYQVLDSPPSS